MHYSDILKIRDLDTLKIRDLEGEDLGRARREFASAHLKKFDYIRSGAVWDDPIVPNQDGPWVCESSDSMHEVGYQTGSGNRMPLLIHTFGMERGDVPLLTEWEQVSLCGDCKGSSGGCPGFAPRFLTYKKSNRQLVVITVSIDFIWSIMYATPNDGWLQNRVLKQLVYADRLTMHYCNRMLKHLRGEGFPTLGLGNCAGCWPKNCSVIRGEKCKFPKKRTFSMEAVGIDCDALHERFYNECLLWYYKGTSKIPMYMTRYVGAFVGDKVDEFNDVVHKFVSSDKSYISIHDVPEPREAAVSLLEIPAGQHKGDFQYVYNDPGAVQV